MNKSGKQRTKAHIAGQITFLVCVAHDKHSAVAARFAALLPENHAVRKSYKLRRSTHAVIVPAGETSYPGKPVKINVVCIKPLDRMRVVPLTATDIIKSFDMRQCAIAMTADSKLRPEFFHEHDALKCARERRIVLSQHAGYRMRPRKLFERIDKYLKRGFELHG